MHQANQDERQVHSSKVRLVHDKLLANFHSLHANPLETTTTETTVTTSSSNDAIAGTKSDDRPASAVDQWSNALQTIPHRELQDYAQSMSELFENCWEGTEYVSRFLTWYYTGTGSTPDVAGSSVDAATAVGAASSSMKGPSMKEKDVEGDRTTPSVIANRSFGFGNGLCGRALPFLKQKRAQFFQEHKRSMSEEEYKALIAALQETYQLDTKREVVLVADVGSCHGGLLKSAPRWLKVLCMDLVPAVPSVWQGDWLKVPIVAPSEDWPADTVVTTAPTPTRSSSSSSPPVANREEHEEGGGDGGAANLVEWFGAAIAIASAASCSSPQLRGLRERSLDCVVMCYMLSYLPSGPLRWEAVMRAVQSLRSDGGLLVLLEAKRGAHRKQWQKSWIAQLEAVGLSLVRQEVMKHTVFVALVVANSNRFTTIDATKGSLDFE